MEGLIHLDPDTSPPTNLDSAEPLIRAFFEGRNERTVQAYRADLQDFARFVSVSTTTGAASLLIGGSAVQANLTILGYRASLVTRGLSSATINRRLAAIRSLLKLAKALGLVTWDVIAKNSPVMAYRDTRGPSVADIRRLLGAVSKRGDRQGLRDFALLRCLYDLGLRRNEAVTLDLTHIDLAGGVVEVLRKGRTERQPMTLAGPTLEALTRWISIRGSAEGPLFPNCDRARKGDRLTGVSVNRIVAQWGTKVGLTLTAHQLRHAAITHALDATNGDVRAVARFSGHRQLQTLVVYDDNRTDMAGQISGLIARSADPEDEFLNGHSDTQK
jgi:integrase/recombinase XerC